MRLRRILVAAFILIASYAEAATLWTENFDSISASELSAWNGSGDWRTASIGSNDYYRIGFRTRSSIVSSTVDGVGCYSGNYCYQQTQKSLETTGSFNFNIASLGISSGYQEIYIRYYERWTGPTAGTTYDYALGQKIFRVMNHTGSVVGIDIVDVVEDAGGDGDADGASVRYNGPSNLPDWRPTVGYSPTRFNNYQHQWVRIEYHIRLNDVGSSNGIIEIFLNGTKIGSRTNINWGYDSIRPINCFEIGGWYSDAVAGGGEGGSSQTNYRYIDDIIVSTTGPIGGSTPPSNNAPSVNITTLSQAITSDSLSVTGTSGDSDGTVASCYWSITDSTPDTGDNACTNTGTNYSTWSASTSGYSSGSNTLYVGCYDGTDWGYDSISVNYQPLAEDVYVSVTATDSTASEPSDNGTFRVSRSPYSSGALTINNFTITGQATSGIDYTAITSIIIADGDTYVDVSVVPIDDYNGSEEDSESVILTIYDGTGYYAGTLNTAIVQIADNDVYPFGTGDIWGEHADSDHTGTATDTYLNSGAATTNNSQTGEIRLYTWPSGTNANTGIIKFDLSSVSTSTTIEAATLYLYMANYDGTETNPYSVSVHKIVNHDPTISEATWNVYSTGNNWTSGGGLSDIDTAESTTSVGIGVGTWYSWDVSDMVQGWITTPASNYGLLLKGASTQLADEDRYFAGSLSGEPSQRPVLLITTGSGTSGEAGTSPPGGTGRISIGGSGRMNPK